MTSPTYSEDKRYHVLLARPVQRGVFKMLPRDRHKIEGATLNEIIAAEGDDVIASVEEI